MTAEPLSAQDALVAIMIAVAAADEKITDSELDWITTTVNQLPVFKGYDSDRIRNTSAMVADLLEEEDGLDALVGLVGASLPDHLNETAYALACDVAAADGSVAMTELKLLEMIRYDLEIGRLTSAAIERGARARHQRLEPRN